MKNKVIKYAVAVLLVLIVGYNSVYFKKLSEVKAAASAKTFNAPQYANNFWTTKLVPNLNKAIEVNGLVKMLEVAPAKTFDEQSHALGIGNLRYFLVRGSGEITSVNEDEVIVLCKSDSAQQVVKIATEFIFGNAVRDATGLVNINEFKNTMDFNNVSAELNKKIREEVLPSFKKNARTGNTVEFVGALELNKEHLNTGQLEVIPVQLKIVP